MSYTPNQYGEDNNNYTNPDDTQVDVRAPLNTNDAGIRRRRNNGDVYPASTGPTSDFDPSIPYRADVVNQARYFDRAAKTDRLLKVREWAFTTLQEISATYIFVMAIVIVAKTNGALLNVAITIACAAIVVSHVFPSAHFNMAVTLYATCQGFFDPKSLRRRPKYYLSLIMLTLLRVGGQFVGSVLAALSYYALPGASKADLGKTSPASGVSWQLAFGVETGWTVALLYSVGVVSIYKTDMTFVQVGPPLVLLLGVLMFGPVSGGSFNFSRSFGPGFLSDEWDCTPYIASQLTAVAIAIALYAFQLWYFNTTKKKVDSDNDYESDDEEEMQQSNSSSSSSKGRTQKPLATNNNNNNKANNNTTNFRNTEQVVQQAPNVVLAHPVHYEPAAIYREQFYSASGAMNRVAAKTGSLQF